MVRPELVFQVSLPLPFLFSDKLLKSAAGPGVQTAATSTRCRDISAQATLRPVTSSRESLDRALDVEQGL